MILQTGLTIKDKEGGMMNKEFPVIGFIGAGRVGFTLGRYFVENGLNVSGYYSRTYEHAVSASQLLIVRVIRQ